VSATEDTPRRMTPTERLHEVTMASLTRAPSPPEHAAEVSRNAKGHYQFTVTVRGYDLDDVIDSARDSAVRLAAHFPYPDSNGGPS
jgi:predicted aspartyl protease